MIAFSYYLLKVFICSGILFGYYRVALHNKVFHQWNRFYLLCAVILSAFLPLIRIHLRPEPAAGRGQVIRFLNVVTSGDEFVFEASRKAGFQINSEQLIAIFYFLISAILVIFFLNGLARLFRLLREYPKQRIENIHFINSEARGTPFSFFNYIFWNRNIEINSPEGQQIFRHELAHVREKHSWDKLFMNIVLFLFWSNPFFWLIRKELNMIHEFIADSKSLEHYNTASFAAMILHSAYPHRQFNINNYFFYPPIKRRLLMLTKMQNPRVSYISRVLVLPLLTFVFVAFTFKTRNPDSMTNDFAPVQLDRTITVVIDPGHGGDDNGVSSQDGTHEMDINLAIARKVQQLNKNEKLVILLTRDKDIAVRVRDRPAYAQKVNAEAFISIHANATSPQTNSGSYKASDSSGFDVYISSRNKNIENSSTLLGSIFINEMKGVFPISEQLKKRTQEGVWVLDAPGINYAAMLIECGYLNNEKDARFIENEKNQELVASRILRTIEKFASVPVSLAEPPQQGTKIKVEDGLDTLPVGANKDRIKSVEYTLDGNVLVTYIDGKQEKMSLEAAKTAKIIPTAKKNTKESNLNNPIVFLNGKEMPGNFDLRSINQSTIKSIDVLKDEAAMARFGKRGKNGVIFISAISSNSDSIPSNSYPKNVLYIIDGVEALSSDTLKNFRPEDIESIRVIKGEDAISKYGKKGENGVIEITSRKNGSSDLPSKKDHQDNDRAMSSIVGKGSQLEINRESISLADFGFKIAKEGSSEAVNASLTYSPAESRIKIIADEIIFKN
jgi:N-acetylmuramoyl-L-alanine amidase